MPPFSSRSSSQPCSCHFTCWSNRPPFSSLSCSVHWVWLSFLILGLKTTHGARLRGEMPPSRDTRCRRQRLTEVEAGFSQPLHFASGKKDPAAKNSERFQRHHSCHQPSATWKTEMVNSGIRRFAQNNSKDHKLLFWKPNLFLTQSCNTCPASLFHLNFFEGVNIWTFLTPALFPVHQSGKRLEIIRKRERQKSQN